MSQIDVLNILQDLGGMASTSEIRRKAKRKFPDRSLSGHVEMRLQSLQTRNLVEEVEGEERTWKLVNKEWENMTEEYSLNESCDEAIRSLLDERGISVTNIVSVYDIDTDINLLKFNQMFENSVYHPENDSQLTFYPEGNENLAIRIPSTGRLTLVGADSKESIITGIETLGLSLEKLGISFKFNEGDVKVQNIVGTANFDRELKLSSIADDLPPNEVEYEPENFSGMIYRPNSPGTVIIYRTGKILINSVRSYREMDQLYSRISTELNSLEENEIPI